MARNCARPGVRLEPRSGAAADHVLEVAVREHADLIALGWSQRLDEGRAHTVRQAIATAFVPVMLFPVAPPSGTLVPSG